MSTTLLLINLLLIWGFGTDFLTGLLILDLLALFMAWIMKRTSYVDIDRI